MTEQVLIVDDSLTVRMDLAEAFQTAGFQVSMASSIAEARAVLARAVIDVVVLDVRLPDGDGVDLLRDIRATDRTTSVSVLMLSTEAEVKDRIRALQTGADAYVGKPYDTSYVIAKARERVRQRRGEAIDRPPTILVIDDSVTFREQLRGLLEQAGYQVLVAPTGEDGLHVAAEHRPTAIVVDGELPGIDGATVIRHLRLDAALRGTPCLLLTASEDRGAELRALDAGADAFLRKGDDPDVIIARLAAAIRRPATGTGAETISLAGPRKVLVVHEGSAFVEALGDALRGDGYDLAWARSGVEAIELLAVESVDCILLDRMTQGADGLDTCRRIKAAPIVRDIPLIILTEIDDRAAVLDGLAAGADDYLQKSTDFEVLKARVRALIRRKQFEDETRQIREELLCRELEATEARAARELAETRAALVDELERKNKELESFSYSVSHDLRAPLRSIDGFSQALLDDHGHQIDAQGQAYLQRVRAATRRMGELIDDLLQLSRVGRAELHRQHVDLSRLALDVVEELKRHDPNRSVQTTVEPGLAAEADARLIKIVFENLVGNAWKFTSKVPDAAIEIGTATSDGVPAFFVKDNGAGFDMSHAEKLFRPFHRLHAETDFAGTGIGLATIHRIVDRHGGRAWVDAAPNRGATFWFTLKPKVRRAGEGDVVRDPPVDYPRGEVPKWS